MKPLAHSAGDDFPAQSYHDHIAHVHERAVRYAEEANQYAADSSGQLHLVVANAAAYHDLGKLDTENQKFLSSPSQARHLPVNHVDAGSAFLLQNTETVLSGITVSAHHRGLPDIPEEFCREESAQFRDEHSEVRKKTKAELPELLRIHHNETGLVPLPGPELVPGDSGVFLRMALSCLADADHSDTAESRGQQLPDSLHPLPELRADERLKALDRYVEALKDSSERSALRSTMYQLCRDTDQSGGFVSCDSPVGSGKTTAIMAHLLTQAQRRGLRRIFVVLPYTNIITQAVEVYRKAVTLPGEDPEEVIAELHHQADFEDESLRYLTALWRAPIIVTTAVSFFETLASNRPSTLRKLHELPGSAIFIDEAHAALPVHLLSTAWHWMKALAEDWGCYWLLASGSLVRFWELSELIRERTPVPELVSGSLHSQLMEYETNRIRFCYEPEPLSRPGLIQRVWDNQGPRLLIVNTVQNAAVLARDFSQVYGRNRVEHLSTALTPEDRAHTIEQIKQRLADPRDTDWVLIATSCVEAGVDFSFRTGFREAASLISLLQTAGRINRNGIWEDSEVWTFQLQDDAELTSNPALSVSADILLRYFEADLTPSPALSTRSVQDELHGPARMKSDLYQKEIELCFRTVSKNFIVIDSDTVPVVIDRNLAEKFCTGKGTWRELQKHSVSISRSKLKKYPVTELNSGLYVWDRPYSAFLGYMEGII